MFSSETIGQLRVRGVEIVTLSLHLGPASFLPLQEKDGAVLPPAQEDFAVSESVLDKVAAAKRAGGRVIAVGTTAVRAIESAMLGLKDSTKLFIQPGFQFKAVDAIITNFHQPGTTHLLLVEAFIGEGLLRESYALALERGFRFLSYGDGMFLC